MENIKVDIFYKAVSFFLAIVSSFRLKVPIFFIKSVEIPKSTELMLISKPFKNMMQRVHGKVISY